MNQCEFGVRIVDNMRQQITAVGDIDRHEDRADIPERTIRLEAFLTVWQPDGNVIPFTYIHGL